MENQKSTSRARKSLKRPNGAGTIYKIKDKEIWAVQFSSIDPATGNKQRKTRKFRTRKLAFEFLEDLNNSARKGFVPASINKKMTISTFLDNHIQRYISKKAPETLRNYQGAAKRICGEIGGLYASQLTPRDVEDMLISLSAKYGSSTVANAYAVLRTAYNKAVKLGEINSNPTLKVDSPSRNATPTSHIPRKDFQAIYEAASLNPYSHARVEVGMFVPIRPGEILGLRWDDINWQNGTILIERQLQWVKGEGLIFRPTKNKKSRIIPLTKGTLEVLKQHKAYQEMNKHKWEEDNNLIFPNTVGKPLDAKRDYKWWREILNRAGVKNYQLYQMRKTAISNLENLGTPTSTILKFTGHSSITTVYNHYASSTDRADEEALAGLENLRKLVHSKEGVEG
jgi:integrase